ncbi:amidohydrolase [Saprospiraceae bacterium]|nr:amidohydrolase [Saprospiraceae bacterium]
MFKINGHGHLLPYPEDIPNFMREKKIFWVDKDRKFMRQGDWKRPITDPSFFLQEKLEWMEKNEIQHEVVLNLSQLYCNGFERKMARDVIRFQNDFNAKVQHTHPNKFTTGFVVQPAYVEDALEEVERAVKTLGMNLLCLPTHFLDQNKEWTSVANPAVEPIFELANQYNLAVEIHPYDGPKIIGLKDQFWRFHLVWMCAQTADTYHFYTLLNYAEKYPNLRVCFAHGNQFGQVNVGRRVQGFDGRPDLFEGATHPNHSLKKSNLFFDTLVHDVYSFRLLKDRQGSAQIVSGLDDPYPLGEMESVPNCYPGKVIDEAVEFGFISEKERKDIWFENVVQWLYGDKREGFLKRIGQKKGA